MTEEDKSKQNQFFKDYLPAYSPESKIVELNNQNNIVRVITNSPKTTVDDEKIIDMQANRDMRSQSATWIGIVLTCEIALSFAFVVFVGLKWLDIPQWFALIFFDSIIIQSFACLAIILKYLFKK